MTPAASGTAAALVATVATVVQLWWYPDAVAPLEYLLCSMLLVMPIGVISVATLWPHVLAVPWHPWRAFAFATVPPALLYARMTAVLFPGLPDLLPAYMAASYLGLWATVVDTAALLGKKAELARPPRVFVSYTKESGDHAFRLAHEFAARGFEAWLDRDGLSSGRISKVIEAAIKGSLALVVVLEDDLDKRPWVRDEVNEALASRIMRVFVSVGEEGSDLPTAHAEAACKLDPSTLSSDGRRTDARIPRGSVPAIGAEVATGLWSLAADSRSMLLWMSEIGLRYHPPEAKEFRAALAVWRSPVRMMCSSPDVGGEEVLGACRDLVRQMVQKGVRVLRVAGSGPASSWLLLGLALREHEGLDLYVYSEDASSVVRVVRSPGFVPPIETRALKAGMPGVEIAAEVLERMQRARSGGLRLAWWMARALTTAPTSLATHGELVIDLRANVVPVVALCLGFGTPRDVELDWNATPGRLHVRVLGLQVRGRARLEEDT